MSKTMRSRYWRRVKIYSLIWTLLQCSLSVTANLCQWTSFCSNLFCCYTALSAG